MIIRYIIFLLLFLTSYSLFAQRKSKYVGTWEFSTYFSWQVLKIKPNNKVVFFYSGCTVQNMKKKGSYKYLNDSIIVELPGDTNIFYLRENRLGSYINDTLKITNSFGYKKVYFKKVFGGVFHKESPSALSKRNLRARRRTNKTILDEGKLDE